jgi:pyruvate dehydrogenase E2 component (dihydrolipoamide acetyltransferase)
MDVKLPKIGEGADSGVIVSILVKPGDTIEPGQTILELENEKAIAPVPSPKGGVVKEIKVKEGDTISVGTVVLTVEAGSGDGAKEAKESGEGEKSSGASGKKSKTSNKKSSATKSKPKDDEDDEDDLGDDDAAEEEDDADTDSGDETSESPTPAASPYVRKVARDLGLTLSRIRPQGKRITLEDIGKYIARLERRVARAGRYADEPKGLVFEPVSQDFAVFGPVQSEPMSPLRQVIASRMVENKVSLPHVTQFDDADMSRIEELRKTHKAAYEKAGAKLTPTPFILHALVQTLKKHPKFNASLNEVTQTLVLKQYIHIGIAVDTESGLLVPVLKDADKKSLLEIAGALAEIAAKARDRKLGAEDMKGGSFTVSNQGSIGGGHFTPIINKPEAAILGIGKTALKPVVTKEGKIEARPMMPLTVSYDHRLIDGGAAARFTVDLVRALQEFPEDAVKL